ncbi:MAG: YDG domain-containing protein, partial [Limnobacter sp.]
MNNSLNHIYRVVWNASLGLWQVASEVARSSGKTQSEQRKTRRLKVGAVAGALAGLASLSITSMAFAQLPTGGQVVGGQASISLSNSQNGNVLNINQTTDRAAIDWQTFNVGQGNAVNFNQPSASSIALNRVLGSDVSVIQGAINANGQVFLVNQNGILFTPTAQVNVGGIVASTQSISTADFMAGKYTFSGNSTGTVENQGNITTSNGGTVALIAAKIINTGIITVPQGTVGLAAGNTVTLDLGGPVKIQVTEGALNTAIEQGGGIVADGGQIYLTAKAAGNLAASAINHTGITRARTLAGNQKGEIVLIADMEVGTTTVAGTLDASAPNGGDGGFIETSAANVKINDGVNITTQAVLGNDGEWLIDPHDFTIAAAGGDITGAALSTALQNSNVKIQTLESSVTCTNATCGTGKADGNGDIFVNDSVLWSGLRTLTLSAHRNIHIRQTITATNNNGKLALEYGQGSNNGMINGVEADFRMDRNAQGVVGKVNLKDGENFSTKLGGAGAVITYRVITSLGNRTSNNGMDLQGIGGRLSDNFALGADIDASTTSGWNGGQGFNPIGSAGTPFTGRFTGLGHSISGLTINRTDSIRVGLFGLVNNSIIRDVQLTGFSVSGNISAGLLAGAAFNSKLQQVSSAGQVQGGSSVGGLVGQASATSISRSFSSANVTATALGSGGLVGFVDQNSTLKEVYATGAVVGVDAAGGLVGRMFASDSNISVTDAFATGEVRGSALVGGLIGSAFSQATLTNSAIAIDKTYAAGKVTGQSGLIGGLTGELSAAGPQTGLAKSTVTLSNSFWDTTTSTLTSGFDFISQPSGGVVTTSNVLGKTTEELKNPFTLINAGWDFVNVWGKSTTGANNGYMQLRKLSVNNFDDYFKVTVADSTKVYGDTNDKITGAVLGGADAAKVNVAFGSAIGELTDAGDYSYASPNVLTVTNKIAGRTTFVDAITGKLTIAKKNLTVELQAAEGSPLSKEYNGNDSIALNSANFKLSGFVGQQGVGASVNQTVGTFNSKNVLEANTITANLLANNLVVAQGVKASNYALPASDSSAAGLASIAAKSINVTGIAANGKTYDGKKDATLSNQGAVVTGVGSETLTVSTTGEFDDPNAGARTVNTTSTLGNGTGGLASNYSLANATNAVSATIAQKALTVAGIAANGKTYDGNTTATFSNQGTVTTGVGSETLTVSTTGEFNDPNAGTRTVNTTSTLGNGTGGLASNYSLTNATNAVSATIEQKTLTVTGIAANGKTYDGKKDATLSNQGAVVTGVGSETLTVSTTGEFDDPNAGARTVNTTSTLGNGTGGLASNYVLSNSMNQVTATIDKKALSVTAATIADKVYDGQLETGTVTAGTLSGFVEGESGLGFSSVTGIFADKDVARDSTGAITAKTATIAYVLSDAENNTALASNYSLADTTGTGKITPKSVTLVQGDLMASDKAYDGSKQAFFTGKAGDIDGLVKGEILGQTTASGEFASKDVARDEMGKVIAQNVSIAYTLVDGENPAHKASNYSIAGDTKTATINPKELVVKGTEAANKTYDGTRDATLTLGTLEGLVKGEQLDVSATGQFASKNVAFDSDGELTKQEVAITYTLKDAENGKAGNYSLANDTTVALIDQKELAVTGIVANGKTYDGKKDATLKNQGVVSTGIDGEALTVSTTGVFDDKNAGDRIVITTSTLGNGTGGLASNYKLSNAQAEVDATIAKKILTIEGTTVADKTYDGDAEAAVSVGSLKGLVEGEQLGITSALANFEDQNVARDAQGNVIAKNVNVSYTLKDGVSSSPIGAPMAPSFGGFIIAAALPGGIPGGSIVILNPPLTTPTGLASNYTLADEVKTATINPKVLTVTGTTVANKSYDGTRNANVTVGVLDGLLEGEALGATTAKGEFKTKNVVIGELGNAIKQDVTIAYTLTDGVDGKATNYSVAEENAAAIIDRKAIAVSSIVANSKTYDGNATATFSNQGAVATGVEGESLTVSTTGVFNNQNAGVRTVTASST